VLVIGGGSTGCAVAHDLSLRGLEVVLVERGELASATTGRCSCFLHSGARYVVTDTESAAEAIAENEIIKRIMPPYAMESNGGLFILLNTDDPTYADRFFDGCHACGVPVEEITPQQAWSLEPNLTREMSRAAIVPDAVADPLRFALAFAATARANGARFLRYTQVEGFLMQGNRVAGVRAWDRVTGERFEVRADMVVNAAGPWADAVSSMAGIRIPLSLSPGIHVIIGRRFTQRIVNLMHMPSSGDFVTPQRNQTILGTTSWTVADCDQLRPPPDHIDYLLQSGATIIPAIARYPIHAVNAAARPLIAQPGASERELSRTFQVFDHAERDQVAGFVTIAGGKMTTARAMAEKTADVVTRAFGLDIPCRTREVPLLSFRRYYFPVAGSPGARSTLPA
jgi:glycerol-3-phosphate dehydrogenase